MQAKNICVMNQCSETSQWCLFEQGQLRVKRTWWPETIRACWIVPLEEAAIIGAIRRTCIASLSSHPSLRWPLVTYWSLQGSKSPSINSARGHIPLVLYYITIFYSIQCSGYVFTSLNDPIVSVIHIIFMIIWTVVFFPAVHLILWNSPVSPLTVAPYSASSMLKTCWWITFFILLSLGRVSLQNHDSLSTSAGELPKSWCSSLFKLQTSFFSILDHISLYFLDAWAWMIVQGTSGLRRNTSPEGTDFMDPLSY